MAASETAPWVSVVRAEYQQVMRQGYGYAGDKGDGVCVFEVGVNVVFRVDITSCDLAALGIISLAIMAVVDLSTLC